MYKRSLNVCMEVLHVCKKALKLVQGAFARVQKDIEVSSRGFARVQKGLEVSSMTMTKITSRECKINCVRLQQNSSITRLFYDVKRSN